MRGGSQGRGCAHQLLDGRCGGEGETTTRLERRARRGQDERLRPAASAAAHRRRLEQLRRAPRGGRRRGACGEHSDGELDREPREDEDHHGGEAGAVGGGAGGPEPRREEEREDALNWGMGERCTRSDRGRERAPRNHGRQAAAEGGHAPGRWPSRAGRSRPEAARRPLQPQSRGWQRRRRLGSGRRRRRGPSRGTAGPAEG